MQYIRGAVSHAQSSLPMEWITIVFKVAVMVLLDILVIKFLLKRLLDNYRKADHLSLHGFKVSGVIVEMVCQEDADQHMQYAPVVEFYMHEGVRVVGVSRDFSGTKPVLNGEVSVCYNEENPLDMLVDARSVAQVYAWMLGGSWLILIIVNGGMVWELLRGGF
jgi:hypothetical protein